MAAKAFKIAGVKVEGKAVYTHPDRGGLRIGAAGRFDSAQGVCRSLPKGVRRVLRKALRAAGHHDIVAESIPN